jgi:hypothetical protein
MPGVITHPSPQNVFAFAFNNATTNGANPLLSAVQRMKRKAPDAYKLKYANTEQFIHQSKLRYEERAAT